MPTRAAPNEITRRGALRALMGAGAAASLLLAGCHRRRSADSPFMRRAWAQAHELRSGRIDPEQWRTGMDELARETDVAALSHTLGVHALLHERRRPRRGPLRIRLPLPARVARALPGFAMEICAFEAGRGTPPHAHDNIVSQQIVLSGRIAVRHFDRIRDDEDAIVVRPTIDRILEAGEASSTTDRADNVHAHRAVSRACLLDVHLENVDGSGRSLTHLIDVDEGEPLGAGLLSARRMLAVDDAVARYG